MNNEHSRKQLLSTWPKIALYCLIGATLYILMVCTVGASKTTKSEMAVNLELCCKEVMTGLGEYFGLIELFKTGVNIYFKK